jgi:predicted acyltransferase (DUF342 family)
MPVLAPIALTAVTASLLALPVTPALFELHRRHDAAPLPVTRHNGRIANFAESFQSRLEPLRAQLAACRLRNALSRVSVDGLDVLLVGGDDFNFDPALIESVAAIMFAETAVIPPGVLVSADVYAGDTLELGEGAALRAAFAIGDIILGENSSVLRWLHSQAGILLKAGSTVYGRLSAAQSIALASGCSFQRVNAPQILTLGTRELDDTAALSNVNPHFVSVTGDADPADANEKQRLEFPDARAFGLSRRRIHGDFVLPADEILAENIIATGEVRIGSSAHLSGSIKGYKDVVVEEGASVRGTVVSERSVRLDARCFVAGPIMAETGVAIGEGSQIGEPSSPTTVSSPRIQIAPGCRIHGTIWARESGSIKGRCNKGW